MLRLRVFLGLFLAAALALGSCKHEPSETRYPSTGQTGYPTATYSPPPGPTTTAPPTPTPTATPAPTPTATSSPTGMGPNAAVGLPCNYDTDMVCAFGRCVGGRCGGCRSDSDCKSGAACLSSPVGMACLPNALPSPAPTATATTAPTPTPTSTPPPATTYAAARDRCVQKTNEYRAKKGVAPLSRRANRESCVDAQSQGDATSNAPHQNFGKCGELAQNECPGWKGTPDSIVDSCLKAMFDEGPGQGAAHGHYNNMTEASYTQLACGFFVAADGSVWLVQDYYR